jgi:hypothetical protein
LARYTPQFVQHFPSRLIAPVSRLPLQFRSRKCFGTGQQMHGDKPITERLFAVFQCCSAAKGLARMTVFAFMTRFVFEPEMFAGATFRANHTVLFTLSPKTVNTRLFIGVFPYKI